MWDQYCNASEREEEARKMAPGCDEAGRGRKEEPCRKNPINDCPSSVGQAAGDPSGIRTASHVRPFTFILCIFHGQN